MRGTVLDAGCGLGTYVDRLPDDRPDLAVVPLDLPAGMGPEVVGDPELITRAWSTRPSRGLQATVGTK
ncbi:MAG: hypothetical protein ABI807_09690 [Sporichthyaceae bacterium]